jgi:hypothetical protein
MAVGSLVPGASSPAIAPDQLLAANAATAAQARSTEGTALGEANQTQSLETMPQLQSGIASAGEAYGTSSMTAQQASTRHFKDNEASITQAGNQSLVDLTRQQNWAALGLIA